MKMPIPTRMLKFPFCYRCATAASILIAGLMIGLQPSATSQNAIPNSVQQNAQASQLMRRTGQNSQLESSIVANRKPAPALPAAATAQPLPAVAAPPAPQMPDWPVNDTPTPAKISWDSHGLRVEANNSSLVETLHEAALDVGMKVDGLQQDQRIFGTYGPGPVKDVLSQLLDGSGYNVLLVGDLGHGTPRQIILSQQTAPPPQTGNNTFPAFNTAAAPAPQPPEPPPMAQPQPLPNPFVGGGNTIRTPQEIMLEMQQRMQEMQQQK